MPCQNAIIESIELIKCCKKSDKTNLIISLLSYVQRHKLMLQRQSETRL